MTAVGATSDPAAAQRTADSQRRVAERQRAEQLQQQQATQTQATGVDGATPGAAGATGAVDAATARARVDPGVQDGARNAALGNERAEMAMREARGSTGSSGTRPALGLGGAPGASAAGAPPETGGVDAAGNAPPVATFTPPDIEAASKVTGVSNDSKQGRSFNHFWGDMNNRYAVFAERLPEGKSWQDLGKQYGANVNGQTTDQQLFDSMLNMSKELGDGHTSIQAPNLGLDEEAQEPYPHEEAMEGIRESVEKNYMGGEPLKSLANGNIAYGRIPGKDGAPDTGYISVTGFEGLSSSGEEADDTRVAHDSMKEIMKEMGDVGNMVVDVRSNGGGFDDVAKEMAAWFPGDEALAWEKQHREPGGGFSTAERELVDAQREGGFSGPTKVLQSGGSFSAAETFGMAMRTRDQDKVTFVGEPTQGHYSDVYGGDGAETSTGLPGDGELQEMGWTYGFSGEIYKSGDGQIEEGVGIPVQRRVDFDAAAFEQGRDNMLDEALKP